MGLSVVSKPFQTTQYVDTVGLEGILDSLHKAIQSVRLGAFLFHSEAM